MRGRDEIELHIYILLKKKGHKILGKRCHCQSHNRISFLATLRREVGGNGVLLEH